MTIQQFDIEGGIYRFSEQNLVVQRHAHPALEILLAREGAFTLTLGNEIFHHLSWGMVKANQPHALDAGTCSLDIIMIEPGIVGWHSIEEMADNWQQGVTKPEARLPGPEQLNTLLAQLLPEPTADDCFYDPRIAACRAFIQANIQEPDLTLETMARYVHLSSSRLSHLFRDQTGISIQKYLIWARMKNTIHRVLFRGVPLTEAAYTCGFYDPAHFSRHFKALFGLKPSAVYNNSRIVQV